MVKVLINVDNGNVTDVITEEEGMAYIRDSNADGLKAMSTTIDPLLVSEAEKEAVFTSSDVPDDDSEAAE